MVEGMEVSINKLYIFFSTANKCHIQTGVEGGGTGGGAAGQEAFPGVTLTFLLRQQSLRGTMTMKCRGITLLASFFLH